MELGFFWQKNHPGSPEWQSLSKSAPSVPAAGRGYVRNSNTRQDSKQHNKRKAVDIMLEEELGDHVAEKNT